MAATGAARCSTATTLREADFPGVPPRTRAVAGHRRDSKQTPVAGPLPVGQSHETGVAELQRRFRAVLDEVVGRQVRYVVTRGSRPEAALLPYEDFLSFQDLEERDILRSFDRCRARLAQRNAEVADEELARDVARVRVTD